MESYISKMFDVNGD